jgi:DNA-binding protein WhiA
LKSKKSFSEKVKEESIDAVISDRNRNFIRALFIEDGTISDPKRGYHLEFNIKEKKSIAKLNKALAKYDIKCKKSVRAGSKNTVLYISKAETIENFLRVIGASDTLFEYVERRMEGKIGADENRKINIEVANMEKTASIRASQIKDIDYLLNKYKGHKDKLPTWFMQLARLRKSSKNYSLSQMARELSVSKSTIDYRLDKINKMASDVRKSGGRIKIN